MLMVILTNLKKYRDSFGLIVQRDRDGGDAANRNAAAYVYMKVLNCEYDDMGEELNLGAHKVIQAIKGNAPGRYRRHPDSTHWYSNQDNFTADQSIVLQSMLIVMGKTKEMRELFKARITRALLHFSDMEGDDDPATVKKKFPDVPRPIEFAQFIRGCGAWYLWPLLNLFDLFLLIDPIAAKLIDQHDFEVQFTPTIISCVHKYPTPVSLLAYKSYKKTCRKDYLRAYFSEAPYKDGGGYRNGIEPLAELAIYALENYK
jgi:hypothetical protein